MNYRKMLLQFHKILIGNNIKLFCFRISQFFFFFFFSFNYRRDHNAVTAPENLGACDSSWISAAVQAVESAWYLGGHDLVQLSTQQVVDCFNDPTTGSSGCKGGDIQKAYQYIAEHGLQMKADYPYRASQSKCVFNETAVISYIDGFLLATSNRSELQMQYSLLEYGPLAICLDAGYRWQYVF